MPEYHDDPETCTKCWAFKCGACAPPIQSKAAGVQFIEETRLVEDVERWAELEADGREWATLDRRIKASLKVRGQGEYVVGEHLARVVVGKTTKYEVPEKIKKLYTVTGERTTIKLEPLLKITGGQR